MASFEPFVVIFGSIKSISTFTLRLPVSFEILIDEAAFENLLTVDLPLSCKYLKRYFVILLEPISNDTLEHLQINHRIQVIYTREKLTSESNHSKPLRTMNKQLQQFTLDLTEDIVNFYITEGEKQAQLERIQLSRVYFRQARLLREWAMSFAKAEPCHILVIPLNSSRENLNNAVERLEKICTQLNYPCVIVRTLEDYIQSTNDQHPCLFPYYQALLNYEDPRYICKLIKKLSPLRLYLYGNEEVISSEWSNLMIKFETSVMEDEDNWCAFLENEYIDDEIKWTIGPQFASHWQIKRITPLNLTKLDKNLRFQSALYRAFKTSIRRQIDVTGEIFDWYDMCIRNGHLLLQPKTPYFIEQKKDFTLINQFYYRIRDPSSFNYSHTSKSKGMTFIWLDEMINSVEDNLNRIIEPSKWCYFNNVSQCLPFIEQELREQMEIFLVVSGGLGYELFATAHRFLTAIRFVYIYCARLGIHGDWIKYYPQIKGVFNDSLELKIKLEQNLQDLHRLDNTANGQTKSLRKITTSYEEIFDSTCFSIPIMVYNEEQADAFMAHQRTIDALLCLPYTNEARAEMIEEFRRLHNDNEAALVDINQFEQNYNSNTAIQWYCRDSFLYRTINKALRSSNIEMMFKMRFFLIDLYLQLDTINAQTRQCYFSPLREKFYRGQLMSRNEFKCFQQLPGSIISINIFLSTTTSLQIALTFANELEDSDDLVPILFCIETNPYVQHRRPYGNISNFSTFADEDEILFAMGSIFRVLYIENLDNIKNIPVIYLQIVDQKEIKSKSFS